MAAETITYFTEPGKALVTLDPGKPVALQAFGLMFGLTSCTVAPHDGRPCLFLEGKLVPELWEGVKVG